LLEQLTEKGRCSLAVVDVARPVVKPKHVPAFSQNRADGIVAGHFAMMGIVAPERAIYFLPC